MALEALERLDGDRAVVLVVNPASGSADEEHEWPPRVRVRVLPEGADLAELLVEAARDGAQVLGVSGGDGSVGCAAGAAADHGRVLWAVPGGTLNHFAKAIGLPTVEDALAALEAGTVAEIDLGDAGGRAFVNNGSLGIYGDLVRRRDALRRRLRIGRWPALTLALVRGLRHVRPLSLTVDGRPERAYFVFVGNNPYDGSGLGERSSLQRGLLDLRVLRARGRFPRLGILVAAALGRLDRSRRMLHVHAREVRIGLDEETSLAYDGEAEPIRGELVFRSRPRALRVVVPPPGARRP
jgi:diacylglycerol kinase family enzyme